MKEIDPLEDPSSPSSYPDSDLTRQGEYPGPGAPRTPQAVSVKMPSVTPVVTYVVMGITIFVFILQYLSPYIWGQDYPALLGMKVNQAILQGQYYRLFTPMLLHGGLLHIGFNMYALYIFGPGLERYYGHWRYLYLYILAGFAGNVMSFIFSASPSLGASTAIFGLLGAEAVFLYQNRKLFGASAQRSLINLVVLAVINLVIGLSPGIDDWGHIGGLLAGVLFAWTAGPILKVEGTYPDLTLADQRDKGDILWAGVGVTLLFVALAASTIYIRTR